MNETQVDIVARVAGEWVTFERLRQALLAAGANDPLLVAGAGRDVAALVRLLLDAAHPRPDARTVRYVLLRLLAEHEDIIKLQRDDLLLAAETTEAVGNPALQALLQARDDVFARWGSFLRGMQQVGPTLCQLRIDDQAAGTGFLISDRHVLTAFHVIASLVDKDGAPKPGSEQRLTAIFDEIAPEGKSGNRDRMPFLAARHWLVCSSAFEQNEDIVPEPLESIPAGLLDYAVICLAEPAGLTAPRHQKSTPRRWLDVTTLAAQPAPQTQLLVAHFPGGADLRLSVGLYDRHSTCGQRIRYRTPVVHGSSGAPCFTVDWRPYALHNAGYSAVFLNQGVPLGLIMSAIGGVGALRDAQNTERQLLPATTTDGDPIFGREEIAAQVQAMMMTRSSDALAMVIGAEARGGKTYTADLLRAMIIDAGHRAFVMNAESFATDAPEAFARRLVVAVAGNDVDPTPPASPDSRQRARWISRSLANWTRASVASPRHDTASTEESSSGRTATPNTLWIIIDRCDVAPFAPEVHDLLEALITDDEPQVEQTLRFVLLGYQGDLGVAAGTRVWRGALELFSVSGMLPYMRYTLAALGVMETVEETRQSADDLLDLLQVTGSVELPQLVKALKVWAQQRRKRLDSDAGGAIRI